MLLRLLSPGPRVVQDDMHFKDCVCSSTLSNIPGSDLVTFVIMSRPRIVFVFRAD